MVILCVYSVGIVVNVRTPKTISQVLVQKGHQKLLLFVCVMLDIIQSILIIFLGGYRDIIVTIAQPATIL